MSWCCIWTGWSRTGPSSAEALNSRIRELAMGHPACCSDVGRHISGFLCKMAKMVCVCKAVKVKQLWRSADPDT